MVIYCSNPFKMIKISFVKCINLSTATMYASMLLLEACVSF